MDNEIINKSMVFYESFYDATRDLPLERFREVWGAFCEYAFYGIQPEGLSEIAMAIFKMAKPNMDTVVQKRAGGLKGGDNRKKNAEPIGSDVSTHRVTHRVEGANPKGSKAVPSHIYDVDVDVDVEEDIDVESDVVVDVEVESPAAPTPPTTTTTHAQAETKTKPTTTTEYGEIPTMTQIAFAFSAKKYLPAPGEMERFVSYNRKMKWKLPLDEAVTRWIANEKKTEKKKLRDPGFEQHTYDFDAIEAAHLQRQVELGAEELAAAEGA